MRSFLSSFVLHIKSSIEIKFVNISEGMEHWHVHSNGGDGFRVESPIYADPLSTVISDGE